MEIQSSQTFEQIAILSDEIENLKNEIETLNLALEASEEEAITNISVATQIIPVTGQNLPLISSGGSSAWMTCISLGMILSVSSSIKNMNSEKE